MNAKKQEKQEKDKPKELKEEKKPVIDEKDKKIAEFTDTLKRLQAEFENYKKRADKEKCECIKLASKDLIVKLLPVLDSFEIAIKNKDNKEEFIKGIELIYAQFIDILKKQGLKQISALNQKFDPYNHEALLQEESDKEECTVLEELQKGYTLNDAIIRHSKVKVAKKRCNNGK